MILRALMWVIFASPQKEKVHHIVVLMLTQGWDKVAIGGYLLSIMLQEQNMNINIPWFKLTIFSTVQHEASGRVDWYTGLTPKDL